MRVAFISMHTSPAERAGTADAGGMNVLIRALATALQDTAGVDVEFFTRRSSPHQPETTTLDDGIVLHHLDAGPATPLPKSEIDQHLADGMTPYQAVVSSVIVRFRPIMLTALTTVLGLIPMFPSDFWRGLAIAMAAGLTVATMITLVIMPVLYCMVFHIPNEN